LRRTDTIETPGRQGFFGGDLANPEIGYSYICYEVNVGCYVRERTD